MDDPELRSLLRAKHWRTLVYLSQLIPLSDDAKNTLAVVEANLP